MLGFYLPNIFCLLNDKEKNSAQKFWSKDLMHEKTFRLSNHTPHAYRITKS